jgi:hypothetical protein
MESVTGGFVCVCENYRFLEFKDTHTACLKYPETGPEIIKLIKMTQLMSDLATELDSSDSQASDLCVKLQFLASDNLWIMVLELEGGSLFFVFYFLLLKNPVYVFSHLKELEGPKKLLIPDHYSFLLPMVENVHRYS